jgi:hypothetical protein
MLGHMKSAFVATVSAGALFVGLGVTPAAAAALPFQIDPDALATGGPYANVTATDFNGVSAATLSQGAGFQTETGYLQGQSFTNNGPVVSSILTRMCTEGSIGCAGSTVYNLYLLFQGKVNGVNNFGPNQTGVIAPGDYSFALYADINANDVFTPGSTNGASGVNPTVTGTTGDDVLLAVGSSVFGGAGQNAIGAPGFSVIANFIICNGTPGSGTLGGDTIPSPNASVTMSNWNGGAAQSCGTFNALNYFVSPSPFYKLSFNSATPGSANDITIAANGQNAVINGIVADINFVSVPEPSTVMLFGSGLLGLGMFARRRRNSRA